MLLGGTLLSNPATHLVQIALLVVAIFTLFLSVDSTFTDHVGEFVLLILLATTGMMFLVASQDLLVIFISLELLSLSVYILAGFDKRSPRSSEAALKYFLFGGMSAAFMLFGFSLLYGFSNSTNLLQIASAIHAGPLNPLVILAIVTTVIGFGFKIAAAPFHFWAPDVYQGAPTPSAAFIASGSKVASFFIFFQVLVIGFAGAEGSATLHHFQSGWVPVIVTVAVASMLLGNLVAITQTSLRRLLAYSAVAHAGYMLLAFVAHSEQSLAALLYYVATYALATLGIFGILTVTEKQLGNDKISDLAGLQPTGALPFCLPLHLRALPCWNSSALRILREVPPLHLSSGRKFGLEAADRPDHLRHRHERGFPLLLFAGAQERIRRRPSAQRRKSFVASVHAAGDWIACSRRRRLRLRPRPDPEPDPLRDPRLGTLIRQPC